jgi:hypothetical protein
VFSWRGKVLRNLTNFEDRRGKVYSLTSLHEFASQLTKGAIVMKTITSALVALLFIAGVAGAASALDAKTFYQQVDRDRN